MSKARSVYRIMSHLARKSLGLPPRPAITERCVEFPFIFENLHVSPPARLLEVGCARSFLCVELAALGYRVHGIDWDDWPLEHANYKFTKASILNIPFRDASFDEVVAVSTVEHIGLWARRGEPPLLDGDLRALREMTRVLKPMGRVLLTVPFGKAFVAPSYRVYDRASLRQLLGGLKVEREEYYVYRDGNRWVESGSDEAENTFSYPSVQAVVCLQLMKSSDAFKPDDLTGIHWEDIR